METTNTVTRKQLLATIEQLPDFNGSYNYDGSQIRDWCIDFIESYIDWRQEGKEYDTDTVTDMVCRYADGQVDIYYSELLTWFGTSGNYEYLDEMHNELGYDSNGDIISGIRATQAWVIERAITEALQYVIEVAVEQVDNELENLA